MSRAIVAAILCCLPATAFCQGGVTAGQGVTINTGGFLGPAGVPPIPPPPSGNITFSPTAGTVSGAQTICILAPSMTSCGVGWPAGVDVFYTLDGSPANEASQWYSCKTNTSGCISIPDPSISQTVTINAVAVQTINTTLAGCSPTHPCYGVIVQDGMNTKSWLKMNVSCSATDAPACPAANFNQSSPPLGGTQSGSATTPTVQHGDCESTPSDDIGVRGVVDFDWYYVSQAQPSVDPYVASGLAVENDFGTASGKDCGPGTSGTGDTEVLVPVTGAENLLTGNSTISCDLCTNFADSYYVGDVYEGTPASGTTLNPAYVSEYEQDFNNSNSTYDGATGFGYGTSNARMSVSHAAPYTSGGITSGRWEYSSQNGANNGWDDFADRYPSIAVIGHDAPFPFGKLNTALTASVSNCPTAAGFTPGTTIYKGSGGSTLIASPGLEPGWLLLEQGTSKAESILMTGLPGGSITGCVRLSPQAHAVNALASEMVKVQVHATSYSANAGGGTCNVGTANANAMYMDYIDINGIYYGTGAVTGANALDFQTLMGRRLPTPSVAIKNTWGTQSVSGQLQSIVCSYYGSGDLGNRVWNQKQPYTKPGTGNAALIGIFDMHDNVTASWGIISGPAQAVYTQNP
jgi:hypothetical protein